MRHSIAMVSDFFHPNVGGVENHIYQLSQCVLQLGHKVIIITHSYEERVGLHFVSGMLRVYYLPLFVAYNQCILPTITGTLPMIRTILLNEEITIVHGHSSFSILAHETMFHAKTLGIRTVFTDHSLFGFADTSSIVTNKILELFLTDINFAICVSHTSKENTVLRANLDPKDVFVIPNAIDPSEFIPREENRGKRLLIVVMSRLVYRKGIDFLAEIIPAVCKKFDDVDFLIGGDGPKRLLIEETREQFRLHSRVTLLGSVPHEKVPNILNKGHIFLNTSLTEAFCMAIVEAACCGLQVVSTSVGGIPEVLPSDLIHLAEPRVDSLLQALYDVIVKVKQKQVPTREEMHLRVAPLYTWPKVAKRTEKVYNAAAFRPKPQLSNRIHKFYRCGPVIGRICILFILFNHFLCCLLNLCRPIKTKQRNNGYLKQKKKSS
uniref:phosphatidylinositol N-acetylglucosaminyltransferase subunit A n=1 Tax=Ciona intestinalis TaxID=7719 RepID=UPI00006A4674|nr:phosphatidylinositol N-acetylglucosaminyltransferase subunit A [Ciona intestinalis]|eukprot:XP_002120505.1 phosphatidylinositol N-acetylglucosaminyltransferase subunit A [Ciona intestinalis]